MNDIQILGLGLAAIIGIAICVVVLAVGYGALCLHWATRLLRFKKRSLWKAFGANLLILFTPAVGSGGSYLLTEYSRGTGNPIWPFVLGEVLLGLFSVVFPVLILKHLYKQTFARSLVAYGIATILQVSIAVALFLAIAAVLVAMGFAAGKTGG